MPELTTKNNQEPLTGTPQPETGVNREALSELAAAMQDLKQSVDTNTTTAFTRQVPNPIPINTSSEPPPDEVDFTDPASVKRYIQQEMVKVKTEANKAYVSDQARRMYDQLIDQDFPEMQNPASALHKETIKEVRKRMNLEGTASLEEMRQKVPSLFYDAACAASVKLNRTRQNHNGNPEAQRFSGLTGGFVEGGSNPPPPPPPTSGITPEQRYFAEKFGLDPKKVEGTKYEKGSDGTYRFVR